MLSGSTGQSSNSNIYNRHACAACKHQRKKCKPGECVLAPFFPANKPEEFQAILKVFGVKHLANMLSCLDERDRRAAVESYVWEAKLWMEDPVNGPLGHYNSLNRELQHEKHINRLLIQQIQQQLSLPIGARDYVTSEGRQPICNITNLDVISSNLQNSNAIDLQKEECRGQGTTNVVTPLCTISSNFASIGSVEQETRSSRNLSTPDYLRTTNHHGRDQSDYNSGSFWPEQQTVQRGIGQIAPTYVDSLQRFGQNFVSPNCWNNCVNIDGFSHQQPQEFPNNNQIGYFNIQGKQNNFSLFFFFVMFFLLFRYQRKFIT